MDAVVIAAGALEIDQESLRDSLRIKVGSPRAQELESLLEIALEEARPKAMYTVARAELEGEDRVVVDGTQFTSRVLRVNLEGVHRVFPYVATCGYELEELATSTNGMLQRYWVDVISTLALRAARQSLEDHLEARYGVERLSEMNPGSLQDWPLWEQRPLFALLGDVEGSIGVELMESCLMKPSKTVSGIMFPTDTKFYNCQLCPMPDCPGRRAPYDQDLYGRDYATESSSQ